MKYVGGPLDGKVLDVSGWSAEQVATGTYEVVEGWSARANYEPEPGDPLVWLYRGAVPD